MKIFKINDQILSSLFIVLLLNVACSKETEYDVLSGQLIGFVSLNDSRGKLLSDNSGVEVIVDGSQPEIRVKTDEKGQFIIDHLKSGTYNILFNKEGYCQHKIASFSFVGGHKPATVYRTYLYPLPNFQIGSVELTDLENYYSVLFNVQAKVTLPIENSNSYCRYYLSNGPDITFQNYMSTNVMRIFHGHEELNFNLRIDTLKFPVGSELYMILYPASESYQSYTDISSGNEIYTSINTGEPSEVVHITVPEVATSPWW